MIDEDKDLKKMAFGPVPSRRLGQSIGINNIPSKICTYSCIYCQLGQTPYLQNTRQPFYRPQEIVDAVTQKIHGLNEKKDAVDYLTFVANGEPTLDCNLGEEIELLKPLGIKIAVITNASLIGKKEVCDDLQKADWVSLKVDTVNQDIWKRINRPCGSLKLKDILQGIVDFSDIFQGCLVTETMLIQGVNDRTEELEKVAELLGGLSPKKSYISIPIRPPAEPWVKSAVENTVNEAFHKFHERGVKAEYLIGYEGNTFAFTGNIVEDLLGIMSVHPIREDGVRALLLKAHESWSVIESLLDQKKIIRTEYCGKKYYIRKLPTYNNFT